MKSPARLMLLLTALGFLLLQTPLGAGDKKKEIGKKPAEAAKPIVINDSLINADLKDKVLSNSHCKTYTFRMEKDKTYHIELASTAFTAHIRLENADGAQIASQSSSFGIASASHKAAKTEDYTIIATTPNAGSVGKFTLTVAEVAHYDGKPIEIKNENGQGAQAGLLLNTDPMRNGKRHRVFTFHMEEGKTYQIDMTSKAFDSYLFLESPDGKTELSSNDDGGGYPSARIVHKAKETGKHRIITTYFGGGAGPFHLTITQK